MEGKIPFSAPRGRTHYCTGAANAAGGQTALAIIRGNAAAARRKRRESTPAASAYAHSTMQSTATTATWTKS